MAVWAQAASTCRVASDVVQFARLASVQAKTRAMRVKLSGSVPGSDKRRPISLIRASGSNGISSSIGWPPAIAPMPPSMNCRSESRFRAMCLSFSAGDEQQNATRNSTGDYDTNGPLSQCCDRA